MLDLARSGHADAGAAPRELITFRAAGQDFCVDATIVKEVRAWTPATLLPDSPDYVRGAINLRGTILPIVDLAARLELTQTQPTARHVIIVIWDGGRQIGLLVDAVCDILQAPQSAVQPRPNLPSETVESLIAALVTVGDRMVGLLNPANVLPAVAEEAA